MKRQKDVARQGAGDEKRERALQRTRQAYQTTETSVVNEEWMGEGGALHVRRTTPQPHY